MKKGIIGKKMLGSSFPRPFISCHEKIFNIFSAGCVFGTGLIVYGMCDLMLCYCLQHTGCIISYYFPDCNTNHQVYIFLTIIQIIPFSSAGSPLPGIAVHHGRSPQVWHPHRCTPPFPKGFAADFFVRRC